MTPESYSARQARLGKIMQALHTAYPDARCELNYTTPLELLVATILSAQCTDKQVNLVTADLFKKYRSAADYAQAPLQELEQAVRRLGFFRNKSKSIQSACSHLLEHHQGEVPRTMESLTALDGVGRKTANVVLGNAFGIEAGVVVDTHVARLAGLLKLSAERDPARIEHDLMSMLPRDKWTIFSHWLIWHGRRRCSARKPDCLRCEIRALCPSAAKA